MVIAKVCLKLCVLLQKRGAHFANQDGSIDPTDDYLLSAYTYGPLLSRITLTDALQESIFSVRIGQVASWFL
jgi:hypothetical protein